MADIYIIFFSFLIIVIASLTQATVGFGFSLLAVPLLTFIIPMKTIVPLVVVYSFLLNIIVALSAREYIRVNKIWLMILFSIIGIPIGVYGLKSIDSEILKIIVGVLICITSLSMVKGYKVKFRRVKTSYGITGFISGMLNGSLSMSGPPIVLFFSNENYTKNEFRANLALYGVITNIITIFIFIYSKLLTEDMLGIIGINIIAIFFGSYLGIIISRKIYEYHFEKIVLVLLTIIGLVTVVNVVA